MFDYEWGHLPTNVIPDYQGWDMGWVQDFIAENYYSPPTGELAIQLPANPLLGEGIVWLWDHRYTNPYDGIVWLCGGQEIL